MTLYAWKRVSDNMIMPDHTASSADCLFEAAGFGAVETHRPLKGFLAVQVHKVEGKLVEINHG